MCKNTHKGAKMSKKMQNCAKTQQNSAKKRKIVQKNCENPKN